MQIILLSALAGICGMGAGSIVPAIVKNRGEKMMNLALSFAAGVMISLVCFGLIPEALDSSGILITAAGAAAGIIIVLLLNRAIDHITQSEEGHHATHQTTHQAAGETAYQSVHHTAHQSAHLPAGETGGIAQANIDQKAMVRSGLTMLLVIALHNIPYGMVIGAGGSHDNTLGAMLTLIIALHNIPEGMAVATPLLAGGYSAGKTVLLTMLCGATTLLGGVAGVLFGQLSDTVMALILAAAGGSMLYVIFVEILPHPFAEAKNNIPALVMLAGILTGLLIAA